MSKRISISGYEYIAGKIAEKVREYGSLTVLELCGMLRTTQGKVLRAWEMFSYKYPDIFLTPEGYFTKRRTFMNQEIKVGKDVEEVEWERKMAEESIEKELLQMATSPQQTETKEEEKAEGDQVPTAVETQEFQEKYSKIIEYLARTGGADVSEVAIAVGMSPDVLKRQWNAGRRNRFITIKEERFVIDIYSAFKLANAVADVVQQKKLVPLAEVSVVIHASEDAIRDAWEICGSMIKYINFDGSVFKLVEGGGEG